MIPSFLLHIAASTHHPSYAPTVPECPFVSLCISSWSVSRSDIKIRFIFGVVFFYCHPSFLWIYVSEAILHPVTWFTTAVALDFHVSLGIAFHAEMSLFSTFVALHWFSDLLWLLVENLSDNFTPMWVIPKTRLVLTWSLVVLFHMVFDGCGTYRLKKGHQLFQPMPWGFSPCWSWTVPTTLEGTTFPVVVFKSLHGVSSFFVQWSR